MMEILQEIRERIQGVATFPSLQTLCLHRVGGVEESRIPVVLLDRIPVELLERIRAFQSLNREDRTRIAYERGDVWYCDGGDIEAHEDFRDDALCWALVSGHVWAVEVLLKRYYNDIKVGTLRGLVIRYAAPCRHRAIVDQYLPWVHKRNTEKFHWYHLRVSNSACVFMELNNVDRTLGYVLIAILNNDLSYLETVPFDRVSDDSLDGLLFTAGQYRCLQAFQWLLHRQPLPGILTCRMVDEAIKSDDLDLFRIICDTYASCLVEGRRYFLQPRHVKTMAKLRAERIFFHYNSLFGDYLETYVRQLFNKTRSPRIAQWIAHRFPHHIDISATLNTPRWFVFSSLSHLADETCDRDS